MGRRIIVLGIFGMLGCEPDFPTDKAADDTATGDSATGDSDPGDTDGDGGADLLVGARNSAPTGSDSGTAYLLLSRSF